jgi:hypothetical protein
MNAILKNFFAAAPNHRSNKEVIGWWERRRIFYNAVMLAAGCVTIMLALSLGEIAPIELINVLPPVLIFALSANLFYTLGWMVEIACRKFIPDKEFVQKAGPVLFIAGIGLSVFFTFAIDIALLVAFFFGSQNSY